MVANNTMRGVASKARVLVVGSGRMGQIRAGLLQRGMLFELAGIVDPVQPQTLAATYGVPAYKTLTEAIDKSSQVSPLHGLIVSSPTFSHEAVIKEAAESGLHTFTEKPVGETADQIEMLFDYTDNAGVSLCCGFQRRFDASYMACTEAVHTGQVGTPTAAQMFFADHPSPPRDFMLQSGNIFMDLSAHDVDYMMFTLQDAVTSVYATGSSSDEELAAAGVFDTATMVMNFSRGATVTLFMSRSAVYGYDQRCEVFGSAGLVSVQNVHEHTAVLSNGTGVHSPRLKHSFPERFNTAFLSELTTFAGVLAGDVEWPVTRGQCINVMRVADAARLSAETGKVVPVTTHV